MFEALKAKLQGPVYTIFTPFGADENVDFDRLEAYLRHLYKGGARRFYAMAYNSRYSQMEHQEILELNAYCAKVLKDLDKENIVIVGDPIHCSTATSLDFALQAKDAGADIISLIFREKYFGDDQVLEHYAKIGRESNFPLLVHEMPFLSGFDGNQMHWPTSLLKSLPDIPQIMALKEDAKDAEIAKVAFSLEPRIRVVLAGGGKKRFREFYTQGAKCWLNGISIIDAQIAEVFWQALLHDNKQTQDFIINELESPFFDTVVKKFGWHRTNKALLEAAGLMDRRDRMPLKHLSDEEFEEVVEVYQAISEKWQRFKGAM